MKSSTKHALAIGVLAVCCAACRDARPPHRHDAPNASQESSTPRTAGTQQKADTQFLRFVDRGNGEGVMETAIATYAGSDGVEVDLIAAVHVGDTAYYQRLEKLFAGYDALLYELVKPKGVRPPAKGHHARGNSSSMVSWFQRYMRDTLDLEFQLDAIDYRAKNFVHADLDAETFQKMSDDRGETLVQLMFKLALAEFRAGKDGESKADPNVGLKMIAALFLPDSARALKYLLAQQLEHMEAIMAGLGEGPDGRGSVLLVERNKKCMRVLHDRLQRGDKHIGVFYGGAHLADMETRIFKELGLRRTAVRYERAWVIERVEKAAAKTPPGTSTGTSPGTSTGRSTGK